MEHSAPSVSPVGYRPKWPQYLVDTAVGCPSGPGAKPKPFQKPTLTFMAVANPIGLFHLTADGFLLHKALSPNLGAVGKSLLFSSAICCLVLLLSVGLQGTRQQWHDPDKGL